MGGRVPTRRFQVAPRTAWYGALRGAALAATLAVAAPNASLAETAPTSPVSLEARLVVPLEGADSAALGRGWSDANRRFVSQRGTCVAYTSSYFEPAESAHVALEVLSRAGGHLRLGLHVAVHRGVESVESAQLVDAVRRLERQDDASFRAVCGDAFVAGTVSGAQFVGEFEIGSRQGSAAHSWLQRRRLLGPSADLAALAEGLESFVGEFSMRAQQLPDGRRAAAQPMAPEALIAAAAAFPESPEAERARPYLALLIDYPARMQSGIAIDLAMRPPEAPGRAVFAAMRPRRSSASEMHLARAQRRLPPPGTGQRSPAPVVPVFRVERFPVRVIQTAGVSVYAGANAPPDHFVERAGGYSFWIPGAAAGTPRVAAAIAYAMAQSPEAAPLRWVRRYAAGDLAGAAVYLSPDAPIEGIHSGRNPVGYAWIPGVAHPNARERKLMDEVLSAATPPVSSEP